MHPVIAQAAKIVIAVRVQVPSISLPVGPHAASSPTDWTEALSG